MIQSLHSFINQKFPPPPKDNSREMNYVTSAHRQTRHLYRSRCDPVSLRNDSNPEKLSIKGKLALWIAYLSPIYFGLRQYQLGIVSREQGSLIPDHCFEIRTPKATSR